ncbi:craniofacial development protein 2-like [Dreissena polymorpha]|uniref:craniofacial development protein 2-like n=1 Tax=Dreissena polymorpha TaxID=45954 RepID=UPI002263E698|nr:craniofacial development protein 2-like [Dreissena polymorpha]
MKSYGISLLGVSEARWTGTGKRQFASGQTIAFSGRSDDQHDQGVALIMDQEAHKSLMEWKPINKRRIMSARFNSAYAKLTIIVCYAPTEVAEATEKDAFYDQLQEVIELTQKHDVLLVFGDLNAKVGKDNTGKESTMGTQGCGIRNGNGERLTWSKIDERNEVRKKLLQTKSERIKQQLKDIYATLDRDVKTHSKADKRKFIDNLATEAEDAAARQEPQDMGTLYRITMILTGGLTSTEVPVKNLQGEIVSTDVEKVSCWEEHFERVLNRADPSTEAVIAPVEIPLDINTEPPTIQEIRQAIKKLKNGKAPA